MKKNAKILMGILIPIGLIGSTAGITYAVLNRNNKNYTNYETKMNYDNLILPTEGSNDGIDSLLDQADLKVFYCPGVQPFNDSLKLAMMSHKQVEYIYSPNISDLVYQDSIVKEKLLDFLKNNRKNIGKTTEEKQEIEKLQKASNVYRISSSNLLDQLYKIPNYIINLIKENTNKKINVWVNSYHAKSKLWINMSTFKNVKVLAINDSNSIIRNWKTELISNLKTYLDLENAENNSEPQTFWWKEKYILIPNFYKNYYQFYHDKKGVEELRKYGADIYPFSYKEEYEIKNEFFNARDKDNKRLAMTWWSEVTTNNWKTEVKKIKDAMDKNNKENLIYLGSNSPTIEKNHILSLYKKYKNKYNIIYKGHPGHITVDQFLKDKVNQYKEIEYFNIYSKKRETIKLDNNDQIIILNNQIQSEEITTNHINEGDKVKIHKWASCHYATSAFKGLQNGFNKIDDVVMAGIDLSKEDAPFVDIDNKDSEEWKKFVEKWGF
ncbi:hypothetical protein DMC14_000125 [Metamycoplasma phocicerebrale]|uniref:Uncharacterized protein n=1 Tax=Metamycoplasma phocicerebrale TaxID=142649 RepID=A0A3Q9V9W5_9BACT|nr:hypothetical protein [Metamycoplasma phocicerebrale]AZZ65223.1 hypothetical protein DMC14_000125 [Metamycoplasma phocicerebrale]